MDKDVRHIAIRKSKRGFIVELVYTNNKLATFLVEGFDLKYVFEVINRQNNEVHRVVG